MSVLCTRRVHKEVSVLCSFVVVKNCPLSGSGTTVQQARKNETLHTILNISTNRFSSFSRSRKEFPKGPKLDGAARDHRKLFAFTYFEFFQRWSIHHVALTVTEKKLGTICTFRNNHKNGSIHIKEIFIKRLRAKCRTFGHIKLTCLASSLAALLQLNCYKAQKKKLRGAHYRYCTNSGL